MTEADHVPDDATKTLDRREFASRFQLASRRLWLIAAGILGDRSEAEDVVQEAAIIAFRKLGSFRPGSNFTAWLAEIVRRCAANRKRKSNSRRTYPVDPQTLDRESASEVSRALVTSTGKLSEMQSVFDDKMLRALDSLSKDARCCLLLRVVEGLAYHEISELLGVPEGTAMSHVHRSRTELRRQLEPKSPLSFRRVGDK